MYGIQIGTYLFIQASGLVMGIMRPGTHTPSCVPLMFWHSPMKPQGPEPMTPQAPNQPIQPQPHTRCRYGVQAHTGPRTGQGSERANTPITTRNRINVPQPLPAFRSQAMLPREWKTCLNWITHLIKPPGQHVQGCARAYEHHAADGTNRQKTQY